MWSRNYWNNWAGEVGQNVVVLHVYMFTFTLVYNLTSTGVWITVSRTPGWNHNVGNNYCCELFSVSPFMCLGESPGIYHWFHMNLWNKLWFTAPFVSYCALTSYILQKMFSKNIWNDLNAYKHCVSNCVYLQKKRKKKLRNASQLSMFT